VKAKEYAARYRDNPTVDELRKIAFDFLMESKALIETRHAKRNEAIFSIFTELENKWRVFVSLSGDETIRPDGFERLVQKEFPFVYYYWLDSREPKGRDAHTGGLDFWTRGMVR